MRVPGELKDFLRERRNRESEICCGQLFSRAILFVMDKIVIFERKIK